MGQAPHAENTDLRQESPGGSEPMIRGNQEWVHYPSTDIFRTGCPFQAFVRLRQS